MRRIPSTARSLSAALLAASLATTPAFAWTAPPGATPVQRDDVDVDDLFVDGDDDEDFEDDDMPAGDADMPMGDYDLEHGVPAPPPPKPKPTPPPKPKPAPVEPVREPPPPRPAPVDADSNRPRRMLLDGDSSPRSAAPRTPVTETEEVARFDTEEPSESTSDGVVVWTVAGVGAALGVAILVGAGIGAYAFFGGFSGPTGTVTVTPH